MNMSDTSSARLAVFTQAFILDARDALADVNVLKHDTVAEVEKEIAKKEENKSSPGSVMVIAIPSCLPTLVLAKLVEMLNLVLVVADSPKETRV